jgi:hypothetical protein
MMVEKMTKTSRQTTNDLKIKAKTYTLKVHDYNCMMSSIYCGGENLKEESYSRWSKGSLARNIMRKHRCYGNYKTNKYEVYSRILVLIMSNC